MGIKEVAEHELSDKCQSQDGWWIDRWIEGWMDRWWVDGWMNI